jgi:glyoxylase-like metal-dependent hydrolase (beta-lactamase superfamily II)
MDDLHLSPREREILRDFDAYCWGSHDVSREDVRARMHELTPEGWARVEAVMMKRLGESMARQRAAEREVERLSRLAEDLRRLIDRLDP